MAILYKHFDRARTVFWALFLCFLLIGPAAQAQNALFTIKGVNVDVTADSALAARDQAFEQAQQQAFSILAERMLSESEMSNFILPETQVISTLIQDFEVTEEKLSSVRYVGTYTFRFKDKTVREYFSVSGAAYTDVGSRPVLILPYYQRGGGQTVLWSPYNIWMQAWNRSNNLGGLVPVSLPLGDIQDVRDIGNDEALTYDKARLDSMVERYGAGEAALVVALPDENLSLVSDGADPAAGQLVIQIYSTDRAKPEFVHQMTLTGRAGQSLDALLDAAVKKTHARLQKDWKKKTLVRAEENNLLQVKVPVKNLNEWASTRRALERVHGINEIVLKSLSPKGARVDIIFQGSEKRLRLALQQADMTLSTPRFNAADPNSPLVYELYLNRYKRY